MASGDDVRVRGWRACRLNFSGFGEKKQTQTVNLNLNVRQQFCVSHLQKVKKINKWETGPNLQPRTHTQRKFT